MSRPSGDVKTTISRGRGGWRGGGGSFYDDQGRGVSKSVWEWFQENWEKAKFEKNWLMALPDSDYYRLVKSSTYRYGIMDITHLNYPGWSEHSDTRAHKLVVKKHDEQTWVEFFEIMMAGYERHKAYRIKVAQEQATKMEGEQAAYRAQREAEKVQLEKDEWEHTTKVINTTAGVIMADLENTAWAIKDKVGRDGDWIENIGDTYIDGSGFGYEIERAVGVKLQVTVSLDLSNSMLYNQIAVAAGNAFRDICLSLKAVKEQLPDDMFVGFFTFSEDDYWGTKRGMRAVRLESSSTTFGEVNEFRPHKLKDYWNLKRLFDGEDTYITPLLREIFAWECKYSDPGAIKLDIVITDAVLEHKRDIQAASVIQETRDGRLQTVLLNFMPEEDWLGSTLPSRCVMVKVDEDNIAGILRNILYEFVGVNL